MSGERRLLIVEDDTPFATQLSMALSPPFRVTLAGNRQAARDALESTDPELVLMDLGLPPDFDAEEGFAFLRAARNGGNRTILVMTGFEERAVALRAVEEGAYDFFTKPLDVDALRVVLQRAVERHDLERENRTLRNVLRSGDSFGGLLGSSPPMRKVFEAIRRVAGTSATVLIEGESGTGKELVARAIHDASGRSEGPFVPLHCAALPEPLLEAELFGHEKGAFTGAVAARTGRFEAAHGGTLFLDEVAALTLATQVKLLRVLEQRTIERVGSNQARPVDIRVVAAANESLEQKVKRGEFRDDLFFRLRVFPLRIPALRERPEDIPLLAEHFLARVAAAEGRPAKSLAPETRAALVARDWPGNVRELLNAIETMAILTDGPVIGADVLPGGPLESEGKGGFREAVDAYERKLVVEAIARAGGAKMKAARELGLNPGQMKYLTAKHGL